MVKFGTDRKGQQRYRCSCCGKTKTDSSIKHFTQEYQEQVDKMLKEKISIRNWTNSWLSSHFDSSIYPKKGEQLNNRYKNYQRKLLSLKGQKLLSMKFTLIHHLYLYDKRA